MYNSPFGPVAAVDLPKGKQRASEFVKWWKPDWKERFR
jgi:hypothetical protein